LIKRVGTGLLRGLLITLITMGLGNVWAGPSEAQVTPTMANLLTVSMALSSPSVATLEADAVDENELQLSSLERKMRLLEASNPDSNRRQSSADLELLFAEAKNEVTQSGSDSSAALLRQLDNERLYGIMLCALCVISLCIIVVALRNKEHTAKDLISAAGLTMIIFSTVLLVLIVDTSEQLTAAIGILGAISGYLFRTVSEDGGKVSNKAA